MLRRTRWHESLLEWMAEGSWLRLTLSCIVLASVLVGAAFLVSPFVTLFAVVVLQAILGLRRNAWAREAGYWDAKAEMLDSLQEAGLRGLTFTQWIQADLERTTLRAINGAPTRRQRKLADRLTQQQPSDPQQEGK